MNNIALLVFCLLLGLGLETFGQSSSTTEEGIATFYSNKFSGRKTSSGEVYRHTKLTAAHPTLPFGTNVKVTNLRNNKSVVVKINDRCSPRKIAIDLSRAAAKKIDMISAGRQRVRIEVVSDSVYEEFVAQEPAANPQLGSDSATVVLTDNPVKGLKLASANGGSFCIQVACLASKSNAQNLSAKLGKRYNIPTAQHRIRVKGKYLYKVTAGNFETKIEAQPILAEIKKSYSTAFITKK